MTIRQTIAANTRRVIADMGEAWQYRTLTSSPSAETQTWSDWTEFDGHFSTQTSTEEYDDVRGQHRKREIAYLRLTDAIDLKPGAQVRVSGGDDIWHIDGIVSRGIGVIRYQVGRDIPLKQTANRDGGV